MDLALCSLSLYIYRHGSPNLGASFTRAACPTRCRTSPSQPASSCPADCSPTKPPLRCQSVRLSVGLGAWKYIRTRRANSCLGGYAMSARTFGKCIISEPKFVTDLAFSRLQGRLRLHPSGRRVHSMTSSGKRTAGWTSPGSGTRLSGGVAGAPLRRRAPGRGLRVGSEAPARPRGGARRAAPGSHGGPCLNREGTLRVNRVTISRLCYTPVSTRRGVEQSGSSSGS
jgi:hypothetical protein